VAATATGECVVRMEETEMHIEFWWGASWNTATWNITNIT